MKSIGTAVFTDFDGLLAWYQSLTWESAAAFVESLRNKRPRFDKTPIWKL